MKMKNFANINKPILIAEIGNNHEGSYKIAKKLVYKAYRAGVDGVKFQTFKTDLFQSQFDNKRFKRLKSFELSEKSFIKLGKYAKSLGLLFISTPLDIKSSDFLEDIVDFYKIASGDNNFFPLIKNVILKKKPVIISTGFLNLTSINELKKKIIKIIGKKNFFKNIAFLHCVSSYPTLSSKANLRSILRIKKITGTTIGYSDHTIGIDAVLVALSLGAKIIEKHFTLNKKFSNFRDHKLSADPKEMKELSVWTDRIHLLLGDGEKKITSFEKKNLKFSRRSIYAAKDLKIGKKIKFNDLIFLRPAKGEQMSEYGNIIGKIVKKNISKNNLILKKYIK